MRRAVFLDRDGVVNRPILRDGKPYPPPTLADLRVLPGVREACQKLREAGFVLILVTNQPDIARGSLNPREVAEINSRLQRYLQFDDVRVCPHDDLHRCECRKPKPGLLLQAAQTWNIHLPSSFMVGDRWRDVQAGHTAGCQTIFVDHGYRERQPEGPFLRVHSLRQAAEWILRTARMELQYV
jgi:D-glycero-D-manno-heptose 1,7-bisphosphate phosphatase